MTDSPGHAKSTLHLCTEMIVKSTLYLYIGMILRSTLYLCFGMIFNDWQSWSWEVNFVFVYLDDC